MLTLDLDVIIRVLSHTLFSPSFCLFLPLTFLAQVKSWEHPAVVYSAAWTAFVCCISLWTHIDNVYRNDHGWIFRRPKLDWGDQIVLITGGATGIGALLAETLAMRNVTVVVMSLGLSEKALKRDNDNENLYSYECDVSDYKAVHAVAERIRKEVGDPTIIVNNAGVVKGKLLLDLTEEDITSTFGSNTLAQFWILKAFLPAMLKRGKGHVVSISSLLGLVGCAQMTDYNASKAALISLNQSLRYELDKRYLTPGIRTSLILPAWISTPLFSSINFPSNALFEFLVPKLNTHDVVKAIVSALDEDESRIVRMPFVTQAARILSDGVGIIPSWFQDLLHWVGNADFAMKAYGPHPDAGERLAAERAQGRVL